MAAGIHNWNEGGARRFLARALSTRRRGQRRPTTRSAIMSHISHLPPALLLSSLLGSPVSDGLDYEVKDGHGNLSKNLKVLLCLTIYKHWLNTRGGTAHSCEPIQQ